MKRFRLDTSLPGNDRFPSSFSSSPEEKTTKESGFRGYIPGLLLSKGRLKTDILREACSLLHAKLVLFTRL